MMAEEIRYIGELQRLELKPGDRFVLTTDRPISHEQAERIKDVWHQFVGPERHELLILDNGMKLGVISEPNG